MINNCVKMQDNNRGISLQAIEELSESNKNVRGDHLSVYSSRCVKLNEEDCQFSGYLDRFCNEDNDREF
jgi:hypothetical protein